MSLVRPLMVIAIACLVIEVALVPLQAGAVAGEPAAAISLLSSGHAAAWLAITRGVLAVAAVVLLGATLRVAPATLPASTLFAALVLVTVSEVLGRLLFYASAVGL